MGLDFTFTYSYDHAAKHLKPNPKMKTQNPNSKS